MNSRRVQLFRSRFFFSFEAMVDRTKYPADQVPDLALRQVFGRQRLPENLCLLLAGCGLLNVETVAMLGESITSVKTTLKTIVADEDKLGATEAAREISLTSLAAVWKMCSTLQEHFAARRAKMEEDPTKVPEIPGDHHAEFREQFVARHPDVLLPPHREPHRKLVERIQRDYMVHGAIPFYQVGEMRIRSEQVIQKSGISKTAEDLIRVVAVDQPVQAASESQVIDKLHAFFVALEYLNICEFTTGAGPLRYLAELEEWRHENRGLALLLTVDTLIRRKTHRLNHDQRKSFPTFSSALLEVLTNHKQLWNDARSSAELDKFKQAGQQHPETPVRAPKRQLSDDDSPIVKPSSKAKRNKARRERHKVLLAKAKASSADNGSKPAGGKAHKDARVPSAEWDKITSFKYNGKRRCPFYNCSMGCRFGDSCRHAHVCVECGKDHPWHGNHWARDLQPPPGVWLAPRGSEPEPKGTNDHVEDPLVTVPTEDPPVWNSWQDVPKDPREVATFGRWFVEVFSGTARLTQTVRGKVPCLPPIDITLCAAIPFAFDVVDLDQWEFFMQLIFFGCIFFAHFGTPCNSYSGARKDDVGPPPLRSSEFPDGLPVLSDQNLCIVFMGNLFNERTCEACIAIVTVGGDFSIENPLGSLIWETPSMKQLIWNARAWWVDLDQCAFGAPSRKPTRLILSNQRMQRSLHKTCPGNHVHEVLKGKVYSEQFKKVVYRTKLAQEYPWELCRTMAKDIQDLWQSPLSHLEPSFDLKSSDSRKRPVGQDIPWKIHRQQKTALNALSAGYQLKRGALKPLIDVETDPGVAVQWALQIPHPFSVSEPLSADLQKAIDQVSRDPQKVNRDRELLLAEWSSKAAACLQESDQLLRRITDPYMRRLLRGGEDSQPAKLGSPSNIALYQAFALAVGSPDVTLAADLVSGFPMGNILPSNRWPAYDKEQTIVSLQELHQRAWAIRHKIVQRVKGIPVSENLIKIWEATMEDVQEGSSLGPFGSEEEVTVYLIKKTGYLRRGLKWSRKTRSEDEIVQLQTWSTRRQWSRRNSSCHQRTPTLQHLDHSDRHALIKISQGGSWMRGKPIGRFRWGLIRGSFLWSSWKTLLIRSPSSSSWLATPLGWYPLSTTTIADLRSSMKCWYPCSD